MLTAKFGSIWPSCFRGEDKNMKMLTDGRRTPSDGNTSHPGELKNEKKKGAITPRRVIRFTAKFQGM
jgi:hypothetical protein